MPGAVGLGGAAPVSANGWQRGHDILRSPGHRREMATPSDGGTPFLAHLGIDRAGHVPAHTLDRLFPTLAREEGRLRATPSGRGSELLRRVCSRQ